jgi:beta-phosphoglucomutase-like phosphatase (HAD superfamily)
MIKAIIFDLDGTLIQTEVLKATSYARAINFLTKCKVSKDRVLDIFGHFVGLSRQEVVGGLAKHFKFELENALGASDFEGIKNLLIAKRLELYHEILEDSDLLSKHFCPFTLGLFHKVYSDKFHVVLATMSHLKEAERITSIMGIYKKFEFILTRDDVSKGKPAADIYEKAKSVLGLKSKECLVIEDSVNGVRAALAAGMHVFAVTNQVTRESVYASNILEPQFLLDSSEDLGI